MLVHHALPACERQCWEVRCAHVRACSASPQTVTSASRKACASPALKEFNALGARLP